MARRGNLRLSTAVEQYLNTKRGRLSPSTVSGYASVLERFTREVGDLFVENIKPQRVEEWLTASLHRPDGSQIAPSTYNQLRVVIGLLNKYLTRRGAVREDWLLDCPPMRIPKKRRQQVDRDRLWEMLDAVSSEPRDRALLATGINTALRAGDLTRLKVGDLDLDGRVLAVYVSKSRVEDEIPLTEDLAAELEQWLAHYTRALFKAQGRHVGPEDHLFPAFHAARFTGAREIDENGHQRRVFEVRGYDPTTPARRPEKVVQKALEALGLPTHQEGLHTLRRSVARIFFDDLNGQGHDAALRETASLLHHSSVTVTERYLGLSADRKRRDEHLRTVGILGPRPSHQGATIRAIR